MFGIIEIIIVVGIILLQSYLAYKLWFKIEMYRAIFDFDDLPIISQKNISKEVIETGDVSQILQYVDNGEGVINITFLKYIPKNRVLSTIVKYINVYLIKNKGTSIDFHLIKDIVDKHTQTIETQIENRIPAPLYLGLAATMIGIIAGLMSVDFSISEDPLDAIQPLINGIKWAMSASAIGLLITTFFSIKIYKDAQTEADEEKSEFLSKLQSELMPRMATGKLPEVSILSDKIDLFARATNFSVAQLSDIVKMSNKTIEHEQTLIKDIANLDVKGLSRQLFSISLNYTAFFENEIAYDAIIHLAGKAHDLKNTSNDNDYFETNFGLTKKLFDKFLKSDAKIFIFMSSVKAAADSVEGALTEDVMPRPLTVYGKSKLAGEIVLKKSSVKSIIIRTSWLFSPFGNNFVKTILALAESDQTLKVVNDQWGSPTYGPDLANMVLQLLRQYPLQKEIFHVVNAGVTNWCAFAQSILKQSGLKKEVQGIPTEAYPTPAPRPQRSVLGTSKIQSYLGTSLRSWEEALADCLNQLRHG